jgi:hypothetical protein
MRRATHHDHAFMDVVEVPGFCAEQCADTG